MQIQIRVYVCPTEGCGNYFASSSTGERLEDSVQNRFGQNLVRRSRSQWFTRAHCPDCRARGIRAVRVPVTVSLVAVTAAEAQAVRGHAEEVLAAAT